MLSEETVVSQEPKTLASTTDELPQNVPGAVVPKKSSLQDEEPVRDDETPMEDVRSRVSTFMVSRNCQ